ncbi:MAG: arginase family protein, partial [Thermosphaera sp.]
MGVLELLAQETISFACLPKAHSAWSLLGIPFDYTTTYKPGTRFAPDAVRSASCNLEFYSILTGLILEDERINDIGNLVLPPGDVKEG